MPTKEVLQQREAAALKNSQQIATNVTGRPQKVRSFGSKHRKSLGATGLITAMLVVFLILFSGGNLIPAAISARLVEATDTQYADAVESKILVFQQALESGSLPENTIRRLAEKGVEVEGSSLIFRDKVIGAGDFVDAVNEDALLYQAFTAATYDRAAYYYDESAEKVFKQIGTTRNNYSANSIFSEVMSGKMGEGSNVQVNSVGLFDFTDEETGETYTDLDVVGGSVGIRGMSAEEFVLNVAAKNLAETVELATMNSANALNVADTITKEQQSSLYFLTFMENISKMKAGSGNSSKINDAMNYLFDSEESEIVDVATGETIVTKGSMLESPSMYAVLTGKPIDAESVRNYASDRVLLRIEGTTGLLAEDETMRGTVTSTGKKTQGTIGRYLNLFAELFEPDYEGVATAIPIINNSMVENSFEMVGGIRGGEMLVEGAVNVGGLLAQASGGSSGDASAVRKYAKLTDSVLALDAEADRLSRSPFDITSKNTFLGSIVYNLGMAVKSSGFWSGITSGIQSFGEVVGRALSNLIAPDTFADDQSAVYLTNVGNCQTAASIGAVGSVACSRSITFDTSTLDDPFHNEDFLAFVEENTEMGENGERIVKEDSLLATFIKYNTTRVTPIGVMDGGILEAMQEESHGLLSSIPFLSDFVAIIRAWLGASEGEKNIATGKSFVNSEANGEWENYKYAQRYVSLARATSVLRQYDGGETAYNDIPGFEGNTNPVIAYLEKYYETLANR